MVGFRRERLLGVVMVNHISNFEKALTGAHASAQWYVDRTKINQRDNIQKQIDAELSGCWRCSGREKGICDCCSHKMAAEKLEKLL